MKAWLAGYFAFYSPMKDKPWQPPCQAGGDAGTAVTTVNCCRSYSITKLTTVASVRIIGVVPRIADIHDGLMQQVKTDSADLEKILAEMNKLRPAYQRYRELEEQRKLKDEKVRLAFGLVANQPLTEDSDAEGWSNVLEECIATCRASGVELEPMPWDEVKKASLWKLMREIARQVVEIQVVELERVLRAFDVKTTRQAIESALATHTKTFRITKRGREKYVSLK